MVKIGKTILKILISIATLFLKDFIVKQNSIVSFHLLHVLFISATLPDKSAIMEETDQELSRYIDY